MKCQVEKLEHFWNILFLEFNRGAKAAEAARNICAVYGNNAIGESMARKLLSCFKEDHFDMWPSMFRNTFAVWWRAFEHINVCQCTRELANVMNCDHSTIVWHLHSMDKIKKSDVWVLYALSQNHNNQEVVIHASLLAHHLLAHEKHRLFLSCIVTGDEKWCLYANIRKMEGGQKDTYLRLTRVSSGPRVSAAKTHRDETKWKWIFRPNHSGLLQQ